MRYWQGLPRVLVASLPLEVRKDSLAVALSALGWGCGGNQTRVGLGDPRGSFPSQAIPGPGGAVLRPCGGAAARRAELCGRAGALWAARPLMPLIT